MLQGKVNAALKLLDQQESTGILPLSDDVLDYLKNDISHSKVLLRG